VAQPNILFIMSDQQRHDWLSFAGRPEVRTPNLDRIARNGTVFTQCITNCPVCAPARVGLAAGLHPFRLGSVDNNTYLPLSRRTYYQRLRDEGYHVGCVGKLDLAKPSGYNGRNGNRPVTYAWGFTLPVECEGKMHAGRSPEPRGPYGYWLREQGLYERFHQDYMDRSAKGWVKSGSHDSVLPTHAFEDIYIGTRSVEWIQEVPDEYPWHLFVSFVGPHDPFDPPTEYADHYRDAPMPKAIPPAGEGKPAWIRSKNRGLTPEEIQHTRRQYCASIEAIDDSVGRILDAVEERGMLDNTIVVFSSDHGEMLGDHGLYTKVVPYEASIRVPLVVSGPGIPAGEVRDALVELIDVNPTICELAGLPAQERIDARSLVPILTGDESIVRSDQFTVMRNFECVRTSRYKLVQSHNDLPELYDLEEDPDEQLNRAGDPTYAEIERELNQRLHRRILDAEWRR
jgi:choline-sulfatase